MPARSERWRSVLFAPANRPELVGKLPRSQPDAVVLDLEDAVPPAGKVDARAMARHASAALIDEAGLSVLVRVNGTRTAWHDGDLEVALHPELRAVIVPKVESPDEIDAVRERLAQLGRAGLGIVAGIETARGLADARAVVRARGVCACYLGAEDFVTDMGGVRTEANIELLHARSEIALAARLAGVPALDIVVTDFHDDTRFSREAAEARAIGYAGKLCIHPAQVPLANAAFVPSGVEVERARRLLVAFAEADARGSAAIAFEGQLVDEPMARRARAVLDAIE
ncbi:MAG TPA: CoA ester lyase [Acidimicrobiales bacterium]|nr:CoA ester lyase [Acidimicrobiales bacterium]